MKEKIPPEGWRTVAHHYLKFNAVGAIGIGVQLVTLTLLVSGWKINYLLASIMAVELAILHNFAWHERWTWNDRRRMSSEGVTTRLARFNFATGAFSLFGNLILMRVLVGQLHHHYLLANIVTIATLSIINFLVSDRIVFRRSSTNSRLQASGKTRKLRN